MKITPVLYVDKIEPALTFWIDRIGFEKTVEVPEGDVLGFVILQHGNAELMLQTIASAAKDTPDLAEFTVPRAGTYIEVTDFDDVLKRLGDAEVIMPERTAFYGMREIVVKEPGGNLICFAGRAPQVAS